MRALRSSIYSNAVDPPLTTVLLESDATDTLESGVYRMRVPGALVIQEIFEFQGGIGTEVVRGVEGRGDIALATLEAMQRQRANGEQEAHQAMLFYWTIHTWDTVAIVPGGTIFMDKPAPLSREEIVDVFEQIAKHPDYKRYRIVSHTRDGEPVELVDGKVKA